MNILPHDFINNVMDRLSSRDDKKQNIPNYYLIFDLKTN